ncbi:MAG TPA: tetratricopeptide repeat protein [Galbitalea sp.]|nr:tetratricopeptide repeat protein [Galbitalea sp.]
MTESSPAQQAQLYIDLHRPAEALRILARVLATNPDDVDALRAMAIAHPESDAGWQSSHQAILAATRVTQLAPRDAHAWRILAIAYSRMGRSKQAREIARTARGLAPALWASYTVVAAVDCDAKLITKDTRESMAEALRLAPNEPAVLFAAGRVASVEGYSRQAREFYERVLAVDPDHVSARNNLAVIDSGRGNEGRALAGYLGILSIDPHSTLARKNLRLAAHRMLTISTILTWGATVAIGGVFIHAREQFDNGQSAASPDRTIPIITAVVAVALVGLYLGWIARRSGAAFARLVRTLPYTEKFLSVWAGVLLASLLGLLVATLTPIDITSDIYGWILLVLAAIYVLGGLIALIRRAL